MAELKTRATGASVKEFLAGIEDDQRRKDCAAVATLMQEITKARPKMWGTAIVKRLDDVHLPTLKKLIVQSLKRLPRPGQ